MDIFSSLGEQQVLDESERQKLFLKNLNISALEVDVDDAAKASSKLKQHLEDQCAKNPESKVYCKALGDFMESFPEQGGKDLKTGIHTFSGAAEILLGNTFKTHAEAQGAVLYLTKMGKLSCYEKSDGRKIYVGTPLLCRILCAMLNGAPKTENQLQIISINDKTKLMNPEEQTARAENANVSVDMLSQVIRDLGVLGLHCLSEQIFLPFSCLLPNPDISLDGFAKSPYSIQATYMFALPFPVPSHLWFWALTKLTSLHLPLHLWRDGLVVQYGITEVSIICQGLSREVSQNHEQLGVVEVQVPKSPEGQGIYYGLNFVCAHIGVVEVNLNLTVTSTTMEIPRIHMQVQQGNDITFQPGSDAQIDLTFKVDGDVAGDDIAASVYIKSMDEENTVQHFSVFVGHRDDDEIPVELELLTLDGGTGNRSATFRLRPADGEQDIEGILDLTFEVYFSNSPVRSMMLPLQVKFYRQDHTGPFPSGFIGFVRDNMFRRRSTRSQIYCSFGRPWDIPCVVYCEAAGDRAQSVELSRLDSNEAVTDAITMLTDNVVTTYKVIDKPQPYLNQIPFQCTAKSSATEITKTFYVKFVMYPKINRTLSGVTRIQNGTKKVTCVATGKPAPIINFNIHDVPDDDVYDVIQTFEDDITTRADVFLPENVNPPFVECTAFNNADREDVYVMFLEALPERVRYYLTGFTDPDEGMTYDTTRLRQSYSNVN